MKVALRMRADSMHGWPTPDGLKGALEIDAEAAQADLKARPFDFGFPLRIYQRQAIETVETSLGQARRNMLLAMATGTGKTKLAIAMLYRVLAAKRFRRVAFVVDRNALGTQAVGEFETTRIVSAKTFADTLNTYSHVVPALQQEAAAKMNAALGGS